MRVTLNLVFCKKNYPNFGKLRTKSSINIVDKYIEALSMAMETWRNLSKKVLEVFYSISFRLVETRHHLSTHNDAFLRGYLIAMRMLG